MWIYGELYTQQMFLDRLSEKGLPHKDVIVKVFCMDDSPRGKFKSEKLYTIEMLNKPLNELKMVTYGERSWSGTELEDEVTRRCSPECARYARALSLFSHVYGFTAEAMQLTKDGEYVVKHPIDVIHGWNHAVRNPKMLHLDIFLPVSLELLKRTMQYEDKGRTIDIRTGLRWRKT